MTPESATLGLAVVFLVTWIAAARWARPTVAGLPPRGQRPLYAGTLLAGLVLAIAALLVPALRVRLWEENLSFNWAMVAVCAIGFAWCWWARLHLGNLWSAGVVLREGHRVIDTGPYGIVRHPMYTGAIVAATAFAAVRARPLGILITLLIAFFFTCKAWLEERFLRQELGRTYDAYRQSVPMLVPFLRLRGSRQAFLRALPSTAAAAIIAVPIVGFYIARNDRWNTTSVAVAIGLILVVFLTNVGLSFAGYHGTRREPFMARLHFITRVTDRVQTYVVIKVFRRYFERAPGWVLLTTRGRKTGLPREVLLPCERFREGLIIISTYGRRSNWIRNIDGDSTVTVTCAGWLLPARAEIIDDLETKRSLVSAHPFFPPAPVFPINTIHVTLLRPITIALLRWWVISRPVVFVRLAPAPSAHQAVSVQQEFGGPP